MSPAAHDRGSNTGESPTLTPTSDSPYRTWSIPIEVHELIDHDLEGFLDLIGERVGNPLLMDITYRPLSVLPDGSLLFEVSGDDRERTTSDEQLATPNPTLT